MKKTAAAFSLLSGMAVCASCFGMEAVKPATPIEHLVVIIGENISFDAAFGAYRPPEGQTISNLLSRKIINADGTPGPNYREAIQKIPRTAGSYQVDFAEASPYPALPRPYAKKSRGGHKGIDDAIPTDLPAGPYQITRYHRYTDYTDSNPVHRFFQMWQQVNAGRGDLFVWTSLTSGEDAPDKKDPASPPRLGGEAMGFYNMGTGDLPYFSQLARSYAISDNYHQPVMGGTMANYFALATGGDVVRYLADGTPAKPPGNQIENPQPVAGTPNWYTQSGYDGGSYTECADETQPGVGAIHKYLKSLPYAAFNGGNCEAGNYYLVNNYRPGYSHSGVKRTLGPNVLAAPPQTLPTIADALSAKEISWRWYNGGRDGGNVRKGDYSSDCDPLTFFRQIMETDLRKNLVGDAELFVDIDGAMPAVAFVSPPVSRTGHPGYGSPAAFEEYVRGIIERIRANKPLWEKTAILITTDEGGGYYDSGYIQTIDFFGDGTRIPLIAVSPWARKGHVEHTYYDHASLAKFIERNWGLKPLSKRSRDNLPNPKPGPDPYVPANRPALGDLFDLFDFARKASS